MISFAVIKLRGIVLTQTTASLLVLWSLSKPQKIASYQPQLSLSATTVSLFIHAQTAHATIEKDTNDLVERGSQSTVIDESLSIRYL